MPATKRAYHHGDLRQALIDAACETLRESSADEFSLRALARRVGVSQTAPYRHFETKNAVFAAIAIEGFRELAESLEEVDDDNDDYREQVVQTGLVYIRWSLANPEKYQFFFDSSMLDFGDYPELQMAGMACFEVLLRRIRAGIAAGVFVDLPVEQLGGTMWSSIHGISSLLRGKPDGIEKRAGPVSTAFDYLVFETRTAVEQMVAGILAR